MLQLEERRDHDQAGVFESAARQAIADLKALADHVYTLRIRLGWRGRPGHQRAGRRTLNLGDALGG